MNDTATKTNPTVAFRVPKWVRDHYQKLADKERRKLSQVLRLALEDHASKGERKKKAA